jgi:putative acetyltransferase
MVKGMITIERERAEDACAVGVVSFKAFGKPAEAEIVERLRDCCPGLLSQVAMDGDDVVGHILFSPARVKWQAGTLKGMGLGPLAVLPERQRLGIGSLLVRLGIELLSNQGCSFVIILGHPDYYPRFGFERASLHGVAGPWDGVPEEAFMVLILDPAAMKGVFGVTRYRDEFDEAI